MCQLKLVIDRDKFWGRFIILFVISSMKNLFFSSIRNLGLILCMNNLILKVFYC